MWLFTAAVLEGRPLRLFNHGQMRRGFTFVEDVVDGLHRVLDRPPLADGKEKPGDSRAPHALNNIGNSRSEEIGRLVALIEQATRRSAIVEMARMQAGDMIDTFADVSALTRDTGFTARTGLEVGVPRFVRWYLNHHER